MWEMGEVFSLVLSEDGFDTCLFGRCTLLRVVGLHYKEGGRGYCGYFIAVRENTISL